MRIYGISLGERNDPLTHAQEVCKDNWNDLEAFDEEHGWVTRKQFLADAKMRLANGEHVYTLAENGRLIHYGWVAAPIARRHIPDVNQVAEFPAVAAYLYDFFTHPEFRNRGIYQTLLRKILGELRTTSALEEAYIGVDSSNNPSRRAIEKIGFSYRFSLFQQWRFFRVRRWSGE